MQPLDRFSFGERIELEVMLMNATVRSVDSFLKNPKRIIDEVWDQRMISQISDSRYILKFLKIPVLDIQPLIEVCFQYENGTVRMQSGEWSFVGNDDLESFEFSLQGAISVEPVSGIASTEIQQYVKSVGFIDYRVSAKVPIILSLTPSLLDSIVLFIKTSVRAFVSNTFPTQYSRAYDTFKRRESARISELSRRISKGGRVEESWEIHETLAFYQLANEEKEASIQRLIIDRKR